MKSKKKLFEFLNRYFRVTDFGLDHNQISNETYGRKSCVYIYAGELRGNLQDGLHLAGFKVDPSYGKEAGRLEVQVSYFQGDRYWE